MKTFTLDQPKELISELTYSCYRFNRQESPHVTPDQWAKIFGPQTMAMEKRFASEQSCNCLEMAFGGNGPIMQDCRNPDCQYYKKRYS